jgi:hypothetical protein
MSCQENYLSMTIKCMMPKTMNDVMKFIEDKIAHEHIYWDQASVLAQLGLLDQKALPVTGIQQSRRIKELTNKN